MKGKWGKEKTPWNCVISKATQKSDKSALEANDDNSENVLIKLQQEISIYRSERT